MHFATSIIARDIATVGTYARLSEELGFATLGVADSPVVALDPFLCLAVAGEATSDLRLGVSVLNPRTRHPLVIANSCLTLDRLAPGRVYLGIGTGNSGVRQAGLAPVTLAELRQAVIALRALHSGQVAELDGASISLGKAVARLPIMISASGPNSLRLAGEVADWVLINVGVDPRAVERALAEVKAGAENAGRDWRSLEIWVFGIGCIDDDRQSAVNQVKSGVAGVAVYLLPSPIIDRQTPVALRGATTELIARYNYAEHFTPGNSANARLLDELDLSDYLVDRFSFAGRAVDVRRRIADLQSIGVDRFWFSLSGAGQPELQLQRLAETLRPREAM